VFDVNVYGVYLVTRHLLPLLLGTPKGLRTVLGITSMSSHLQVQVSRWGWTNWPWTALWSSWPRAMRQMGWWAMRCIRGGEDEDEQQ